MINSREKGARFERTIRDLLDSWWGVKGAFSRTPGSGAFHTTTKGAAGGRLAQDIASPDGFIFGIEAKKREKWDLASWLDSDSCPIADWWRQCEHECLPGKVPLLLFARNNRKILAAFPIGSRPYLVLMLSSEKFRYFTVQLGHGSTDTSLIVIDFKTLLRLVPPTVCGKTLEAENADRIGSP